MADQPAEGEDGEFQAYFVRDLYVFRGERIREDLFYVDYKNKKVLYSEPIRPEHKFEVIWRTDEEMTGCKQVPVTE